MIDATSIEKLVGAKLSILGDIASQLAWVGLSRLYASGRFALQFKTGYQGLSERKEFKRLAGELERAIGNSGDLTEPVKAFLDAFTQTGLLQAMCESAAAYPLDEKGNIHSQPGQLAAFSGLYKQYVGGAREDALRFYEKIVRALTISFHRSSDEALLQFAEEAHRRQLMQRLNSIDRRLELLFVTTNEKAAEVAPSLTLPAADIEAEVRDIAMRLQKKLEDVQIYGPDQKRHRAHIKDIYVPCDVYTSTPSERRFRTSLSGYSFSRAAFSASFRSPSSLPGTIDFATQGMVAEAKFEKLQFNRSREPLRLWSGLNVRLNDSEAPDEFATHFSRAVVLGNPGGGKSTLAQYIGWLFCGKIGQPDSKLPIFVTIRDFETYQRQEPGLTLEDFVVRQMGVKIARSISPQIIRYLMAYGRALLIFDGLDEIMNISKRNEFVDAVRVLTGSYPLCPALVTSRLVGYDRATLPPEFKKHYLGDLTREGTKQYFEKLSKAVTVLSEEAIEAAAEDFSRKTQRATELVSNPLMLALMTWLYHERVGEMPATRARLYKACAELLFEQWDSSRSIYFPGLPEAFDVSRLLPILAREMYQPGEAQTVDSEWLSSRLETFLRNEYAIERDARARRDARAIMDYITGRAWVLTEAGAGQFGFTHRTFLEYFFSRSLNDEAETVEDLFRLMRGGIADGTWAVPAALALEERIATRTPVAAQIVDKLIELLSGASEDENESVTSFAIEALDYLSGAPEGATRALVAAIFASSPSVASAGGVLGSSNARKSLITETVCEWIAKWLSTRSERLTGALADWIRVESADGNDALHKAVAAKLALVPSKVADEDVSLAKIRMELLGTHAELAARNGLGVYDSSWRLYNRVNWVAVDLLEALRQLLRRWREPDAIDQLPFAAFAIAMSHSIEARPDPVSFAKQGVMEISSATESPVELIRDGPEELAFAAWTCTVVLAQIEEQTRGMKSLASVLEWRRSSGERFMERLPYHRSIIRNVAG